MIPRFLSPLLLRLDDLATAYLVARGVRFAPTKPDPIGSPFTCDGCGETGECLPSCVYAIEERGEAPCGLCGAIVDVVPVWGLHNVCRDADACKARRAAAVAARAEEATKPRPLHFIHAGTWLCDPLKCGAPWTGTRSLFDRAGLAACPDCRAKLEATVAQPARFPATPDADRVPLCGSRDCKVPGCKREGTS